MEPTYFNDPLAFDAQQSATAELDQQVADLYDFSDIPKPEGWTEADWQEALLECVPATDKEQAEHSLIYFAKSYLGSHLTNKFSPAHYDLCNTLGSPEKRKRVLWLFPREHAKCQSGDAWVQMADGSRKQLRDVKAGDTVLSLDGWRLKPNRVSWAGATGRKKMLRVTTESGSVLKISPVHRLRVFGYDSWKQGSELVAGDYVAAPRYTPEPDRPVAQNLDQISLLAYWIAEGCRGQGCLTITNYNPVLQLDIQNRAKRLGYSSALILDKRKTGPVGVRIHKALDIIESFGLSRHSGAHDKYVPAEVFKAPNSQIAQFLRVLFECDGCAHVIRGKPVISYTSVSRRLADDVRALLLRFGIVSRIHTGKTKLGGGREGIQHTVLMYSTDAVERFKSQVGFITKTVQEYVGIRDQAKHELVPAAWRRLRAGSKTTDFALRKAGLRFDNGYDTTRLKVAKVAALTGDQALLDLSAADVWWDRIKTVEPIPDEETYDISVENVENYVSDNVVSHNTTIVTFAYVLWCVCYQKKFNIVICSDSQNMAKEFLRNIKTEIESNDKILADFGDLVGRSSVTSSMSVAGKWDEKHIITSNGIQIKIWSPGTQVRGLQFNRQEVVIDENGERSTVRRIIRPDLLIMDDVLNDKHVRNKEIRDELDKWFFGPVFNAIDSETGDIVVIGTTMHHDDLLERMWHDEDRTIGWIKRRTPACVIGPDGVPKDVLWPDRWSAEKLLMRLRAIGSLAFAREFLLNPRDEESRYFSHEWFRFYVDHTVPNTTSWMSRAQLAGIQPLPRDMILVTAIDPNSSDKDKADYTAVVTMGFCPSNKNYYLIDATRDRPSPEGQVWTMLNHAARWGKQYRTDGSGWPHAGFVVETVAYQASLMYWLKKYAREWGFTDAKFITRKETGVDKVLRVSSVSPMVEQGRLYFPIGTRKQPVTNDLVWHRPMQWLADELNDFPLGGYDDGVDAIQRAYSYLIREERRYTMSGAYGPQAIEDLDRVLESYPHVAQYFKNYRQLAA